MGSWKIKSRITIGLNNSSFEYIPPGIESRELSKYLYTHLQSSTIWNSQKIKSIFMMEHYSVLKRKGILTHNKTCMNLKTLR